MKLAYLSNGTVKVEILGGSEAVSQSQPTNLADTFGVERLHHFCIAVEPFVVEEIGRRLAFLTDNDGNMIELSAPMGDA